jgi:Leucine-rich repeat (LRR) protein
MKLKDVFVLLSLLLIVCESTKAQSRNILIKAEFTAIENALSEKNEGSAEKHLSKLIKLLAVDSTDLKAQGLQHGNNVLYFQLSSLKAAITCYRFENARQFYTDLKSDIQAGKLEKTDGLIRQGLADRIDSESSLFQKAILATDTITGAVTLDSAYLQQFSSARRSSLAELDASLKGAEYQAAPLKDYNSLNDANSYEAVLVILSKIQSALTKEAENVRKMDQQSAENDIRFTKVYLEYLMQAHYYVKAEAYIDRLIAEKGKSYLQKIGLQETIIAVRNGAEKERRAIAFEKEKSDAWEQVIKDLSLEKLKKYVDQYPDSRQADKSRFMIGSMLANDRNYLFKVEDTKYLNYYLDLDTAGIAVDSIHALRMTKISNAPSFQSLLYLNMDGVFFEKEDFLLVDLPKKMKKMQCLGISGCSFIDNKIKKPLFLPRLSVLSLSNSNLERIEELSTSQLTVLDISNNKLSNFPKLPDFANQTLYHIDISGNRFQTIPDYIFNCKSLKYLDLGQNKILKVGKGLSNLQQLEVLNLSNNNIANFPVDIFKILSLKKLYLYYLPFTYVPNGIENLKNLEILGLGGDIRQLPIGIEQLPELKGLFLAESPNIKRLPIIILECKKLETLYLSGITADSSLEKISRLRRIKSLYLRKSDLIAIPEFIYGMSNLEELDLSENPIVSLDARITELANLKAIDFNDCKLSAESLIALRFSLPNTDITYFDKQLGKNVLSKKINDVLWVDFKKKYEYYLEGDVESAYELGRYFDDRGDAGIAYIFYYFGATNKQLSGKAKGLINNLSVAEMYDKIEELDRWTSAVTLQNWRKLANYYYSTAAYREYYDVCTCTPRDEGGRKIKLNACNRILNLNNKVLSQLAGLLPEYEKQFNKAMSGNKAALSNAQNWLNVGSIVDYTGVLGSFTGLGSVAGAGLSAFSQSNAERLANEAASVTATVDDMANKMKEIKMKVNEIEGIILNSK